MSARRFIALGTGSQVPSRQRNHNGYFLRWDGHGILFDPGEGTQRQMIYAGVRASEITRILITHFHGDHCLGLAGITQRISLDRVPHEVPVHYPAYGAVFVNRLRHASVFHDVARLVERPFEAEGPIEDGPELRIETRRLDHTIESWGFRLTEPKGVSLSRAALAELGIHGPDVGRLQREGRLQVGGREVLLEEVGVERPGQSMAFVMDTRLCDAAVELARGVDLLVAESTYLSSEAADAHANGHLTAAQAAEIARAAGAGRLVLTHFSQRYGATDAFVEEARAIHADVVAVSDGDYVDLPRRVRGG